MNIGIDIDDTITAFPEKFIKLMEEWITSGFKIFIVTGNKNNDMPRAARLRQLKNLGITPRHYTELCIVNTPSDALLPLKKGIAAYQKKLDIFIDDDLKNCQEVSRRLPNCLCFNLWW